MDLDGFYANDGDDWAIRTLAMYGSALEMSKAIMDDPEIPRLRDWCRFTLLFCAAYKNNTETARVLLQHGAKINALDKYRQNALFTAVRHCNLEVAKLLLDWGIKTNAVDKNGYTPLMIAKLHTEQDDNIIKLLLSSGAS